MQEHRKRLKFTPARLLASLLVILVACCLVLSIVESEFGWQLDLTQGKLYTLSEETEEMLAALEDKITIYTLYSLGNYNKVMMTLLEKYSISCDRITITNIDPSSDRLELKEFEGFDMEVNEGSLVVADEDTGRFRIIDVGELYLTDQADTYFTAENCITAAIDYVTTGKFQRIYFMTGHREADMEELSSFVHQYQLRSYLIEEYDYMRTATEPSPETDIVFCVSPKEDFSETEATSILEYVKKGGTFLLLYDNAVYDDETGAIVYRENKMPVLGDMLRRMGIAVSNGLIVGENAAETGFRNTTIELEPTQSGMEAVFSECTALHEVFAAGCTVTSLVETSSDCLLMDGKLNETYAKKGPFTVGMLSELKEGRAVVFSTSSFLGNTELNIADNARLAEKILRDAAPGVPGVALSAKRINNDQLFINSMLVKTVITLVVLLIFPCMILCAGIYFVRKRKENSERK